MERAKSIGMSKRVPGLGTEKVNSSPSRRTMRTCLPLATRNRQPMYPMVNLGAPIVGHFILISFLLSCSGSYGLDRGIGECSTRELDPFTVELRCDGAVASERTGAERMLIRESAEVALSRGFPFFLVVLQSEDGLVFFGSDDATSGVKWDVSGQSVKVRIRLICSTEDAQFDYIDARRLLKKSKRRSESETRGFRHFHSVCKIPAALPGLGNPITGPNGSDGGGVKRPQRNIAVDQKFLAECNGVCGRNTQACEVNCRNSLNRGTSSVGDGSCLESCRYTVLRCRSHCLEEAKKVPTKKSDLVKSDSPAREKPVMVIPLDRYNEGKLKPQVSLTHMDETKKLRGRVVSVEGGRIVVNTSWGPISYLMQSVCYRLVSGTPVVFQDVPVDCFDTSISFERDGNSEQCWIYCLE